jgi:lipopolysaccharide transport system ATP-binding protein
MGSAMNTPSANTGSANFESAIEVVDVSKCYQIYAQPQDRLKQSIFPRLQSIFGLERERYFREFWALRGVGFSVKRGETVGIIGRNGSGKSTLLQIVCGTLNPTGGSVNVTGRIAALLELGSGFNPEFTGRENIFLNAMVLGLTREQVEQRFDDIVRFADIGDFIEQPIKTYSSGMAVRLAFAVIAHVDAEILIIDEALAVGDAVFTQKCMRFLRRFKKHGTILFVSHDVGSIMSLCSHAVWLDQGVVRMAGAAKSVADAYSQYCAQEAIGEANALVPIPGAVGEAEASYRQAGETRIDFFENIVNSDGWSTGAAEIRRVALTRADGREGTAFEGGERITLMVDVVAHKQVDRPIIGFLLKDRLGQALFGHNTFEENASPAPLLAGTDAKAEFVFKLPLLPNGDYSITVALADGDLLDHVQHHWLHDAALISVRSTRTRYGLVGIPFESIRLVAGDVTTASVLPR